MSAHSAGTVRALALTGATGAGKTTLLHAMLTAAGALERRASGMGEGVGDTSPEARARGHSVELNLAGFSFMDDRYAVIDCPGGVEFSAEADFALPCVDVAVVVADPEPEKAVLLQPTMKALEAAGVPHILFVNRIDQARGSLTELLSALAPISRAPLVARQIPIWSGEHVSGFVDLALERAFVYRAGQPSERIDLPPDLAENEADARFHMLEQLADFDDDLMEQLLSDAIPDRDAVFADLVREMNAGLIVPVFLGCPSPPWRPSAWGSPAPVPMSSRRPMRGRRASWPMRGCWAAGWRTGRTWPCRTASAPVSAVCSRCRARP